MPTTLEVLLAPAELAALPARDLRQTVCVVFDILSASSTLVPALANGALGAVLPVAEIPEALSLRRRQPDVLLAGEREGVRIRADLTGETDFDLGNSPREFARDRIQGRTIVLSTTNGSRALRACAHAKSVLVGSFLNLRATGDYLGRHPASHLLLVGSGTRNEVAFEDVLGAGALVELLGFAAGHIADSAGIASEIYRRHRHDLLKAVEYSNNGRRLLANPDLRNDVPWCLQRDIFPLVARLEDGSTVKRAA